MKKTSCRFLSFIVAVSITVLWLGTESAVAKEEYAARTGKGCAYCHQDALGGPLTSVGFAYIRNGYEYPISEKVLERSEHFRSPGHRFARFVIGYIHLLAAIIFFGAIFYIHIFIRPTRLTGGIPKYERILGVSCMVTLTLTGIYLTWFRIDRWEQFFNNTFGFMLFIKILLFLIMVLIAATAITVVHRGMKREVFAAPAPRASGAVTPSDLRLYDGTQGRAAYVVHEDAIYDVSGSEKWKGGRHFGKHAAGNDLTEALKGAPHGTEVFQNVKYVGTLAAEKGRPAAVSRTAHKVFVVMAYTNLVIIFLIAACISVWRWGVPVHIMPAPGAAVTTEKTCLSCHKSNKPALYADWEKSVHAAVGVTCYDCHRGGNDRNLISVEHLKNSTSPISIVVSPKRCAGCHPAEATQFEKSKHAHTRDIMWTVDSWLNDDMNNAVERTTGCYTCHGTFVEVIDGRPLPGTWPNVGIGRINPDGSRGCCSSCHTRHRFSIAEARKPEACDQCHLGPDHPQIEIYNESKHGTIYHAEGHLWEWTPVDNTWTAGRDYRAPTCSSCHMSAAAGVERSHNVTERLSWETQAPLTVRPAEFRPFPARTDWWQERKKMTGVCLQCHSVTWADDHFRNLDGVVENYNEEYYRPVRLLMNELYEAGLLSDELYFDEELEWEFYEFWHHEGRRARMGAAMMAPDYAWWHGFYELKKRFAGIMESAGKLKRGEDSPRYERIPGRYSADSK
ncbi:MAG: CopD family protein [Deltaproteobacteria bacterium]|nr:CopD family protein [Deltaproteobacteria bacterium]